MQTTKTIKLAVSNQKGGVGKTTTVLNLGAALSVLGKNVLLVDLDPQHHLSNWLEYEKDGKPTISDLIFEAVTNQDMNFDNCIRHNEHENLDYIPSENVLAGMLGILGTDRDSASVLTRIFSNPYFDKYDFIIFDSQPSLDLLVTNILKACDKLLIPVQADLLSYEGVEQMIDTFTRVKNEPDIKPYIAGMLVTMYQANTKHAATIYEALKDSYGDMVFNTYISYRTDAKNAVGFHRSSVSDHKSAVGAQYVEIAHKLLEVCKK